MVSQEGNDEDLQLEAPEHPQSPFMLMVMMSWYFDDGLSLADSTFEVDISMWFCLESMGIDGSVSGGLVPPYILIWRIADEVRRPHCYDHSANWRPKFAHFVRFWVAQRG